MLGLEEKRAGWRKPKDAFGRERAHGQSLGEGGLRVTRARAIITPISTLVVPIDNLPGIEPKTGCRQAPHRL